MPALAPGATITLNLAGLPAGTLVGPRTLRAFVDSACVSAERNEVNNQQTRVYQVQ